MMELGFNHRCQGILLWILAGLVLVSGCTAEGARELPFPTFDAKAPFEELGAAATTNGNSAAEAGASNYEKAIADSLEGGEQDDKQSNDDNAKITETIKRQDVPLAGTLVSSIPLEFDEWQWSTKGRVTIITHRKAGAAQPDALVYVEGFSPLIRVLPSVEIRRFQQTVDPALVRTLGLPGLSDRLMGKLSQKTGVEVQSLTDALIRATSHTMGLGLNYRSGEETFTGWQWVGHNEHGVELRLGRTAGNWHAQPNADASVSGVFSQASQHIDELSGVQQRYNEVLNNQEPRKDAGWPAWMLLGSAVVERDQGLHIAVLCKTTPTCPVAAELSDLLAGIRSADSATVSALREQGARTGLTNFAEQQGLPFVDADKLLAPDELGAQLQDALAD